MRFLHFSFCFLLAFGITTLTEAQNRRSSPNDAKNSKDTLPTSKSEKLTAGKPIDSVQYFKLELQKVRNRLSGLQHELEELRTLKDCSELRKSNNSLTQEANKKDSQLEANKKYIEKLEKDKSELISSLNETKKQNENAIEDLKKQHTKEIEGYKSKSAKIQAFLDIETQKLRTEISSIINQGSSNDSSAVFNKIDAIKTRIEVLKNLTEATKSLEELSTNIQDFEKILKLYSKAYDLLTKDYFEVKNQVQSTISQLEGLIIKKPAPELNQYLAAERIRLISLLKKYCAVYEQAFYFYLNAQDWSYVADKDIEAFKANLLKNPKIVQPIESFPFVKTALDKLKSITPERDRKKPANPFKQVSCP